MKCTINENNEITSFWTNETAPENALECDKLYSIHGEGEDYANQTYFYKLENGKVITTEAGKVWTAQEYARKRQVEYPSMGDQMDMIYKDMKNGTSTHADAVEVVKTKYPKG